MWHINSSKLTLQEVLIMAYMNVREGTQRARREAVRTPTRSGLPVIEISSPSHELVRLEEDRVKPVASLGSPGPGARAVDGSRLRIGCEFTHRRTDFPFCLQPFRRESSRT